MHAADARLARHGAFVAASVGRGWVVVEDGDEKQQQIPFGNDNKKGKSNGKGKGKSNSRFPSGMTTRKARAKAKAKAKADSLRE